LKGGKDYGRAARLIIKRLRSRFKHPYIFFSLNDSDSAMSIKPLPKSGWNIQICAGDATDRAVVMYRYCMKQLQSFQPHSIVITEVLG